jgi:alkylation response protein AidB-like acyl-CoA dehydrogenase
MDFTLDEDAQDIAGLADTVIGDASTHERLRAVERGDGPRFDDDLWSTLAETGVLGAFLPEDHGGAGLGLVALGAALEVAGRHAAAVPLWETLALGALPLAKFAPAELAQHWLGEVASGRCVLTAGWHESGGQPLIPTTIAERSDEQWSLTGTKVCVPAGAIANAVIVPAAIERGSVGLFLVPTAGEGVAVEALQTTLGDPQAAIAMADAPAELVAEGHSALEWALDRAVATQCAMTAGVCQTAVRLTADYTKERKQFEVPLASFQAVAHRAADAFMDTEAIRLTAMQALWRLDDDMSAANEVDTAKYWAAWGGQRVVHAAQHLHGGMGVDRDYPLHRCFLMAKELELQLGGASEHLLALGRRLAAQSA